jgi:hypothetical protein
VHAGSAYRASLYDPDSDKVLEVGPGETIAGRTVESVTAAEVKIKDGGLTRTLSLREGDPR